MLEINKIHCMDCLEGMKQIPDNSIDLIVTDPPYNQGISTCYGTSKHKKPKKCDWDKNFDIKPFFKEFKRIIKNNGMIYIFCNQHNMNDLPKSNLILVWDKKDYDVGDTRIWSCSHEFIKIYKFGIANFKYNKRPRGILRFNKVQNAASEEFKKGIFRNCQEHPTQKPIALIRHIIKFHNVNLILDPFMGSGTTAVACKQLGRNFIGFEISQEYVDIANKRLAQENLKGWFDNGKD